MLFSTTSVSLAGAFLAWLMVRNPFWVVVLRGGRFVFDWKKCTWKKECIQRRM
jgi:hypothetical protein